MFGEASTSYLASPYLAAQLIKKITPDVKLIAILREPAERAISAYMMCRGNGIEKREFHEIVQCAVEQLVIKRVHELKDYIRNGLYAQLLDRYLYYFDSSQLLILNYDDLKNNPSEFMSNITNFVGVGDHEFDLSKKYNTESEHLRRNIKIDDEDIRMLRAIYLDENKKLKEMVPINIDRWLY